MKLIPRPKQLEIKDGYLKAEKLVLNNLCKDCRIEKAVNKFFGDVISDYAVSDYAVSDTDNQNSEKNAVFTLKEVQNKECLGYILTITDNEICIVGADAQNVFYGLQTLRQICENHKKGIPCVVIQDNPDIKDRGVYHDITRGRVPTVSAMKDFVDRLAYYKINSLQLYVEHTFPFKELGEDVEKFGYLNADEIKEIDEYCYDNFIEFVPSIATFGHLFELLQKPEYKHLQCLKDYKPEDIDWMERMGHHTINPEDPESFEIIKSLLEQYIPLFKTDKFNICCDETFDLGRGIHKGKDTGKMYFDFVKKIIGYLKEKGKKVMMWGDILLEHPEKIIELPSDTYFLNWDYSDKPKDDSFKTFKDIGCIQYVCPSTNSWKRLIERMEFGTDNIINTIEKGYEYGASGVLNTNWGDWGHPCDLALSMHGIILGGAKAWNVAGTDIKEFDKNISFLEYKSPNASEYMYKLSRAQDVISYITLTEYYSDCMMERVPDREYPKADEIKSYVKLCDEIINDINADVWQDNKYKEVLLLCAEGLKVMAKFYEKIAEYENAENVIGTEADTDKWLKRYREIWLKTSKESELCNIEKMFKFFDKL